MQVINISATAAGLILLFLVSVECEMRKSWSRKTSDKIDESKLKPITTSDYLKYFHGGENESGDKDNVTKTVVDITTIESRTIDTIELTTSMNEVSSEENNRNAVENDDLNSYAVVEDEAEHEVERDETEDNEEEDDGVENEATNSVNQTYEPEERTGNITENEKDIIKRGVELLVLGRGKKNNWIERIVPLFILPFLIQSAFIPFIVQAIKLLLLKSLLVGKAALLLFVLGFFKSMKSSHRAGVPYYLKEVSNEGPDDRLYHHPYGPDIAAGYRSDDGSLVH